MNSLTLTGIAISVAGTLLVNVGFSEACSNEIIANLPVVVGGIIAWYGRVRVGDVTWTGRRK